jgi:hypothetical protein
MFRRIVKLLLEVGFDGLTYTGPQTLKNSPVLCGILIVTVLAHVFQTFLKALQNLGESFARVF